MASNHTEACAAMRPGCDDEGACDCGYLDRVMREGYQRDYPTPPPAEMCPVCKSVERVGTCPNDYHVPVRCSKCGKEVAYTSNIIGLVVVCAICELYETHPKSAEPAAPSYVCNCGQSFAHEYDRLLHAGDCPSVRKPAAAEVREWWIVRTPAGEFLDYDEPMRMDWTLCSKTHVIEKSAYDAVCARLEEAKVRIGKLLNENADAHLLLRERDEARAECERLRAACKRNPSSGSCIEALNASEATMGWGTNKNSVDTHTALLIAVQPIVKESAEDVLRDCKAWIEKHHEMPSYSDLLARIRAVLGAE